MPRQIKIIEKKIGRRGNNEGSIYQRKDGRWCAQITVGYRENGKAIFKYAYGSSRQEVAKKLSQFTNDVFENGYATFAPSDVNMFYPLLEDWYLTFKEPNIGSGTSEKLRNFMKNHIKPEFKNFTIQQVDMFRLQRFFNGLAKKGLCLQSIKHIKQLLNQFYEQYILKKGLCKENPLDGIIIRSKERNDSGHNTMALTPELRVDILSKLEAEPILKPILTVLMLTGMRPGELIALKWRDVDWENATISIRLAASREIEFDNDGNVKGRRQIISNTKTVLSVRSFKVADSVINCLKEWLCYQMDMEMETGITFTASDCHVFSTNKGEMRSYSGLRAMLQRFLKKNSFGGHGISLYTFRHTFATMLLEERENPKIVSELMGHSKVLTTLSIYSHVISKSVYESTAKTLDRVFENLSSKEKIDEPRNGSPIHDPLKIDSSFDSNAVNFR